MNKIKNTQKYKQNPHKYKCDFPDVSPEKCYERGKYFYIKQYDYSKNPRHLFFVCSFFSLLENNYHLCKSLLKYISTFVEILYFQYYHTKNISAIPFFVYFFVAIYYWMFKRKLHIFNMVFSHIFFANICCFYIF